jgi:calcium-dependent protein kinase
MVSRDGSIKLIDFGLSKKFNKNDDSDNDNRIIGTPFYLAPEAIEGHSSIEGDLWSLGVLMCIIMVNTYPYSGKTPRELLQNIKSSPTINFETRTWRNISTDGKDLIG